MADEKTIAQLEEAFLAGSDANSKLAELRLEAIRVALQICCTPGGKPNHTPYVAGDLYKFMLTGVKPCGPQTSDSPAPSRRSK